MSRVSKAIFRLGELLEIPTELRKTVRLVVMVYYRERIQLKNQQRKKVHSLESRRNQE